MTTRTVGYVVLTLALAACGNSPDSMGGPAPHVAADGTPLVDGFNPPPPPADALQMVSPIIRKVAPGTNTEWCYYSKHVLTETMTVKAGQGFQAIGGHHVVGYWTPKPQKEDLHVCTESDMTQLHFLSGGGAEAGNGIINGLPEGGAFHIPAGAQLVMNVHALNATSAAVDTQAVVNLYYGDPSLKPLTDFYVSGTGVNIPAHSKGSYAASCPAPRDFSAVRLLGHMHEWGARVTITLDDGTGPKTFYDKPGAGDFSFNPPAVDYPTTAPLVIKKGTTITANCEYDNTTPKTLSFPTEMCAAFGYLLGADPEFGCADGVWNHQ